MTSNAINMGKVEQIGLFETSNRIKNAGDNYARKVQSALELDRIEAQINEARNAIAKGMEPEPVVADLLRELRWGHLDDMDVVRPTIGDLFQSINTALRFMVGQEMPSYKKGEGDDAMRQETKQKRMTKVEADKALYILRRAHDLHGAFVSLLDHHIDERARQAYVPLENYTKLVELYNDIENGR